MLTVTLESVRLQPYIWITRVMGTPCQQARVQSWVWLSSLS